MSDCLSIEDLEFTTCIGVTDEERKVPQQLLLSIQWETDARSTAKEDKPVEHQDYERIAVALRALARTPRHTIERLAQDVANLLLTDFKVPSVSVSVKKKALPDAKSVVLTLTRP
ncbi:hypothetical protein COU80_04945 [Candidatus Peregrinibacteria bacterium CG10_big_fil_rev_8_21_14_0_10_55_24]|nr:MAG: hypothetical protein COU80_04945 [Candidatus Peregrinibacteria bacterium CG10_big_fil_rev_8_21_14_0_10_55_24]